MSKLINEKKVSNIRDYIVGKIEKPVNDGRSMKSLTRKLGIGQGKMYAVKNNQRDFIINFHDTVNVAQFYTGLYSIQSSHATFVGSSDEQDTEAAYVSSNEGIERLCKTFPRGKAAGEDGITVDLINYVGDVMLEKLAALYMQRLSTSSVPESWKNRTNIFLAE